jgi:hypothetical protein
MYETKGGQLSEDDMIVKLAELTRECASLSYMVAHLNNSHQRTNRADGFRKFGESYERTAKLLLSFANQAGHA